MPSQTLAGKTMYGNAVPVALKVDSRL